MATVAVINLHRLLGATNALLPDHVLPVDLVQKRTHHEGYTRTLWVSCFALCCVNGAKFWMQRRQ